jgi:hypothetical protein
MAETFITAPNTILYLQQFFSGRRDCYVAYGEIKSQLEKYIQDTNWNAGLKLNDQDLIDGLSLLSYPTDRFTYNIYQVHCSGSDYERLKSINNPVNVNNIPVRPQDIALCKRRVVEMGIYADDPVWVTPYGMKLLFEADKKYFLMGFEGNRLVIRKVD